jgi:transposase-like protein
MAAARLPGVFGLAQAETAKNVEALETVLRFALPSGVHGNVLGALRQALPNAPDSVLAFATAVLRARGVGCRCSVARAARELGFSAGTLRRRWREGQFRPKEIMDCVTVLYAEALRQARRMGWSSIASVIGMDADTLARLRRRYGRGLGGGDNHLRIEGQPRIDDRPQGALPVSAQRGG